jgi:hypothetical protein
MHPAKLPGIQSFLENLPGFQCIMERIDHLACNVQPCASSVIHSAEETEI